MCVRTKYELQPKEIMTNKAGYSGISFGLFGLLGYQFIPRLVDIRESRLCVLM